jgi:hypothetical protein
MKKIILLCVLLSCISAFAQEITIQTHRTKYNNHLNQSKWLYPDPLADKYP